MLMIDTPDKAPVEMKTQFHSVLSQVIKSIRLERGLPQSFVAECAAKVASWVSKLEDGQQGISLSTIIEVSRVFEMMPSQLLHRAEMLLPILQRTFELTEVSAEEDDFLRLSALFYKSKGYNVLLNRPGAVTGLTRTHMSGSVPTLVFYCIEPEFRTWMDEGADIAQVNPKLAHLVGHYTQGGVFMPPHAYQHPTRPPFPKSGMTHGLL